MSLVIPEDDLRASGMTEAELRLEIAVLLFQKERFTLEQGARFVGVTRIEFQQVLASHKIPIHYDVAEFQRDIQTLKVAGLL